MLILDFAVYNKRQKAQLSFLQTLLTLLTIGSTVEKDLLSVVTHTCEEA